MGVRTTTTDAEGRFTLRRPGRRQLPRPGRGPRLCRAGPDGPHRRRHGAARPAAARRAVLRSGRRRGRAGAPAPLRIAGLDHGGRPPTDVEGAPTGKRRRRPADDARVCRGPQRRPRRADVGLPARRRVGLHAGAGRRHPRQQLRRRLRLQPAAAGRRRPGGDRPRPAKRGLRRRRDRRRRAPDDAAGRTADGVGADRRRRTGDRCAPSARRAARSARGRLAPAASATRATASPASPRPPARPCPTTTGSSRWRRDTWSGPGARRRRCARTCGGLTPSAAIPGPYGSNPIGAYTAVDRVSRGEDTQRQLGLHGRLPWGSVLAGRIQQRWQVTVADLDNRYHSSFGDSFFETRRVSARTQTDVVLTPTTGLTAGVEGFGERARSTYITGEQFQEVPIERRTFGGFAEVRQDLGARASVQRRPACRRHPPQRARGRPQSVRPATGLCRRVGDLGEPAPGRTLRRVAGPAAASRARRCAPASAPASGRPTPSSSRSPTTRTCNRNAAAARISASATSCCRS